MSSAASDLFSEVTPIGVARSISERLSQEIVFVLVGPVGSGVTTAAQFIESILRDHFKYKVCEIIKPSSIILEEAYRVGMPSIPREPFDAYIDAMQTAGNKLRERFGSNYLTEKAI